jgi:flagellar assembly protein FliH
MPLSYRIIKNQEVGFDNENIEIPIIPTEGLYKNEHHTHTENIEQNKLGIQVQEVIKSAEDRAKNIIEKAEQEANSIKKKARESGYQGGFRKGQEEGYKKAYDKAIKETNEMKDNARQLLHSAHKESRQYIEKTREEIFNLAASIARSILHFNIDTRDESIIEMVKNALKHAEERKQIIIRSNPDSNLILQTNLYQFMKICPNATFTFLEDKEIKGQGCIIESEEQVINLEIDSQLQNIVSALLEMREDDGI